VNGQLVKSLATDRRIRGPNLRVFTRERKGVSFEEAVRRADAEGLVIASNDRLDRVLVDSREYETIQEAFQAAPGDQARHLACWSGTIVAYVEPGKPFGKMIQYFDSETGDRWLLPVPEKYWDRVNCALVAEHPYFTLEEDRPHNIIIHAVGLSLLEGFPRPLGYYEGNPIRGYYKPDPIFGIPTGEIQDLRSNSVRLLIRGEKRIIPVARYDGDLNLYVALDLEPFNALGVVVEAPKPGVKESDSMEFTYEGYARHVLRKFNYYAASISGIHRPVPDVVGRAMKDQIDGVFSGFESFGKDCQPLVQIFNEMGAFVTRGLPNIGYPPELVLELRRYVAQKMQEVSK